MRDDLIESARRWALAGMDAYAQQEPDNDFAVHHVAVALEHIAKAYLCSLHPALIAAADFNTLLHLVGQGAHAGTPRQRIKTIGLAEVNERVRQVLKTAYPYDGKPSGDPVLAARNGVAHAGLWTPEDVRRAMTLAVRRIDAVLEVLQHDRVMFWGDHSDLTTRLVDQAVTDITLRTEARINSARARYAERYGTLTDEARQAIMPLLTSQPRFYTDHEEPHQCPACGNQAWLSGVTETRMDLAWVDTPCGESAVPAVVFYPDYLLCAVCDLELEGEQLRHANIEEMIDLPDAEPDIPEPDEDWLRGR